jgi:predicted GNAT family acetyltransferase
MLALARVTQPGPFGPRTVELGDYIGIRQRGVLVAMAGERMRIAGFTEISAVCVEAAYRGHGFAVGLVGALVSSIAVRGEIPFLHVFSSNHAAIALYRKLGFALRRRMHLAALARAEAEASSSRMLAQSLQHCLLFFNAHRR